MHFIIDKQCTGKTTKLLGWVREKRGRYLVVANSEIKKQLLNENCDLREQYDLESFDSPTLPDSKIIPDRVMTIGELLLSQRNMDHVKEVSIDDVDLILKRLFKKTKIGFVSITEE